MFFKILSSSDSNSIYSCYFKIFHSFINEAVVLSQIFHNFQRDKYPPLSVSSPSLKVPLANTHTPFSCCPLGIPVFEGIFCFNKLA